MMTVVQVDVIFGYCAIAMIFITGIFLYALLVSRILPRFLLSPFQSAVRGDRGVRKCVFPGGRSMTYEPKLPFRRYIQEYVLFENNGEKYIKCKLNEKVAALQFDLFIYDRKDKITEKISVSEIVETEGYSAEVMLPAQTSYVHLRLRSVNGVEIKNDETETYCGKRAVAFCFLVFLLTFIEGLFANYVIIEVSDLLLGYFLAVPQVDAFLPFMVILATSALATVLIFILNVSVPCKFVWNKKADK